MGKVSLRLRVAADHHERPTDVVDAPASPQAARQRRTRWRDPRLWLGVVLVLGSIVVGARVLASADDTTAVWQVSRDIPSGSVVSSSDLSVTRVHFDDTALAAAYLQADQAVPSGARAARDLEAGEILAGSAVTFSTAPATRQLPLGVSAVHEPADLRAGDHVEVWAVPVSSPGGGTRAPAGPSLVLRDVTILSVGSGAVGVSAERQVLVSLSASADVAGVLRQISNASVVLVRLAG
jgi:hypothetical protein